MALQRTRRPRIRSGRSLRSLGSPLNAQPFGVNNDLLPSPKRTSSQAKGDKWPI
jgi:hypothetical protein